MAGNSQRRDRTARLLRHARELAGNAYNQNEIETLLTYGGFREAADKIWQPVIATEVREHQSRLGVELSQRRASA
jgi:hypothetical protein